MMKLWIDGKSCDIDSLPTIPIGFSLANLADVESARSGRNIEIDLAATPTNNALLGASCDIFAMQRFNNDHHTARIEIDGVTAFEGTAYLLATTVEATSGNGYRLRISEGGADWVEDVVHGTLADLEIPFSKALTLSTIEQSWEGDEAVRFLPVTHADNSLQYSSSMLPVERMMLTEDYHPFISVAKMVQAMFAKSGYTVRSSLLESELGESLYMSGCYRQYDGEAVQAKCNFFARRSSPTTTTADYSGRVYASTSFAEHSLGPIVDKADPYAVDSNGVQMSETFTANNSFTLGDDGNIYFTPKRSAKAGFLLHLEYTTDYKILSRREFCGFDTIEGLNGLNLKCALANTCKDYRNDMLPNMNYRIVVFDHTDGVEYQLSVTDIDNTISSMGTFSSRSAIVTTPQTQPTRLNLYYRNPSESTAWRTYSGDWALYAGYIGEEGKLDVVVDVRIPAQEVNAGESLALDKIWIGGAEAGMEITVGTGTTLRPYFTLVPGYGSQLTFADVASSKIRQADLLTALGEMFNLVFHTDRVHRVLYIEPLEEFYANAKVVDWNHRIDHLQGKQLADCGLGMPQDFILSYIDADNATHRFNNENETKLGSWSFHNPLYGTAKSKRQLGNSLFTTTLNTTEVVGSAPSASIMQVGDYGADVVGIEADFTPRIVCYKGLRELPEGEWWCATRGLNHYPYASFLDEEGTNLCFEDRNNTEGLHRHYAPMLQRQAEGHTLTLNLYLTTAEIASLLTEDGPTPSLRSLFRFDINGERALFRLAKVGGWDTGKNILQCTFERDLNH